MRGILYGVGVGPGDPELMTYKAVRIIKECQVLAVPARGRKHAVSYRIAAEMIENMEEKGIPGSGYADDKGQTDSGSEL